MNDAGTTAELDNLPLLDLPVENAALALQAYSLLGLPWQADQLSAALQNTHLSGRLERRSLRYQGKNLTLLLDVGHNPHAAAFLANRLRARPIAGRRLAVFGLLVDKDLAGIVQELCHEIDLWALAPLASPRSRTVSELANELSMVAAQTSQYVSVFKALQAQCERAIDGDEVLVFGSFYCVAEALAWLAQKGDENGSAG